jgi:lipopolysaccharide export system protein LptA
MPAFSNFRALQFAACWCGLSLCWGVVSTSAWAEKADRNKPMNIEADNLDHDELKQISIFTGKVVATKGTITMRGSRLEVRQDPDGFQYGILTATPGARAFYRQKREGVDEWMEGEGERIEYDGRADRVDLIRKAEFRRYRGTVLSDQMTGQRIIYENLSDQFTVDGQLGGTKPVGNAPSGRVRAVLTPRNTDEASK